MRSSCTTPREKHPLTANREKPKSNEDPAETNKEIRNQQKVNNLKSRGEKSKKNEHSLSYLWDNTKLTNIHTLGFLAGEARVKAAGKETLMKLPTGPYQAV